ncbi:MAG TPA: STAS domain-containing protein [Pyrinomonadaceae bacterium]|nr:STAS domain-containing protein [Pyrinomonadaceae bacterium]
MLKISVKQLRNVAVVGLDGQIVRGDTENLRTRVLSLSRAGAVVLDFARVTMIDAGGLGALLELRAQLESRGTQFALMHLSQSVRLVLAITRLDSVFKIARVREVVPAAQPQSRRARVLASCA